MKTSPEPLVPIVGPGQQHDDLMHQQAMNSNTSDDDAVFLPGRQAPPPVITRHHGKDSLRRSHPRPPPTPNSGLPLSIAQSMPNPLLPSAPASPPTPAPSPTPHQRANAWSMNNSSNGPSSAETEETMLRDFILMFGRMSGPAKQNALGQIVNSCDNQSLSHLYQIVGPMLKKDPFLTLPNELCFRVLEFVDDPRTFVHASGVSRRWREVLSDDQAWKTLCEKHAYNRRLSTSDSGSSPGSPKGNQYCLEQLPRMSSQSRELERPYLTPLQYHGGESDFIRAAEHVRSLKRPRPKSSHRSHFKHRFLVEAAWRKGGRMVSKHITPDQGLVTSLNLTPKYIVVALDNAKIHIFNTKGDHQRTLQGHVMGVWAMVPWDDILVSGGCDRDVRVWNMATGASVHTLRGHTSTVRCLKMFDANTAISGSRDTTLRIWDIPAGTCRSVLMGHQASVRCIEIWGDYVASGSYDTTAKIWSISTGQCLKTLTGHFSQIYAIAFDGIRVATGSLDTSVRIWDPKDGTCKAILQGHTSLVGQLQIRGSTLVTGGSDGSVRVWSLETYGAIHRLAAHDNSVTSLQFDDTRIVSGGSDGRVKIWDLKTGTLTRELSQPAEAVWRVAFEQERGVVLASRQGRTVMEVWDFSPVDENSLSLDGGTKRASSAIKLRSSLIDVAGGPTVLVPTPRPLSISLMASAGELNDLEMLDGDQQGRETYPPPPHPQRSTSEMTAGTMVGGGALDTVTEDNVDMLDAYVADLPPSTSSSAGPVNGVRASRK